MKPSLVSRIRNIWIMSHWMRNEAVAAAAMLVVRRNEVKLRRAEDEKELEKNAGQLGVDAAGNLRVIRVLDDYVVPFECGL
ncbi:uncharacterized protein LOC115623359 [Scaptodrosophila lebanonensis]|uniref:Uncharacterized protein LOC115623359 n=1 Tax=Drosophila lebanonensis TaxID=7225 RepID=A0A6J2TBW2_DROLE|nr:uncharacterized protein LOC115623359 [Scaptodrosophila lebanonensis]